MGVTHYGTPLCLSQSVCDRLRGKVSEVEVDIPVPLRGQDIPAEEQKQASISNRICLQHKLETCTSLSRGQVSCLVLLSHTYLILLIRSCLCTGALSLQKKKSPSISQQVRKNRVTQIYCVLCN